MRLSDPERTLFHDICFNPRTHTGCDDGWFATDTGGRVSIHAPTRGATAMGCKNPSGISVSIHAPTRGATSIIAGARNARKFQSTHPHGVRPKSFSAAQAFLLVSIHAPTRGATILSFGLVGSLDKTVSIHAPTRGATSGGVQPLYLFRVSIHAPTRGATLWL